MCLNLIELISLKLNQIQNSIPLSMLSAAKPHKTSGCHIKRADSHSFTHSPHIPWAGFLSLCPVQCPLVPAERYGHVQSHCGVLSVPACHISSLCLSLPFCKMGRRELSLSVIPGEPTSLMVFGMRPSKFEWQILAQAMALL
jgi:hypothetical protein